MKQIKSISAVAIIALLMVVGCSPRTYLLSSSRSNSKLIGDEIYPITSNNYREDNEDKSNNRYKEFTISNMQFTENETQHVKFSSYNPFEELDNSTFYLDLKELASEFHYPIDGNFTSGYNTQEGNGRIHSGVDLVSKVHSPVYAIFDGVVRMAKDYGDYGNVIVIRHNNGLESVYAHNYKMLVEVGSEVESGDKIALSGRTGNATTNHLHFEARVHGQTFDPELLLDVQSRVLQEGNLKISEVSESEVEVTLIKNNQVKSSKKELEASASKSKGIRVGGEVYDAPKPKPEPKKYHTIKRGESLSVIAQKYSTTINNLCTLNNISRNAKIYVGKKLRVK